MWNLCLKADDGTIRDDLANQAFEMIKSGKCAEAYELRDIVICIITKKVTNEYMVTISVEDCVNVDICIATDGVGGYNTCQNQEEGSCIKSVMFEEDLVVPKNVKISLDWGEDAVNTYKIIRLNHDKIKDMVKQGFEAEEIAEKYGIEWTDEDSKWILEKEDYKMPCQ